MCSREHLKNSAAWFSRLGCAATQSPTSRLPSTPARVVDYDGGRRSGTNNADNADNTDADDEERSKLESDKKLMHSVDFQFVRFRKIKQDTLAEPGDRDAAPAPLAKLS